MVDQSSALRYGRTQASPFRRFYDAKRAFDVGLAKQGRRQHALGLTSPVGGAKSLSDVGFSAKSLGYGILDPLLRGIDSFEMARQGLIPREDMVGEASNVAGILGGGGVAARGRGAFEYDPNTVNIFAGQRAAARLGGSKRENMNIAQEMFDAGRDEREIYNRTGVFKGADGKLRYEILDENSSINLDRFGEEELRLEDFLNHPELFETYPTMRGIRVDKARDDAAYRGAFLPTSQRIFLRGDLSPEQMRSTLLHEAQHAVQDREGFSGGSSPSLALEQASDFADKVLTSTEAKALRYNAQSFDQIYDQLRPLYQIKYHNDLDNIIDKARKGTVKPRDVFRQQDWYRYGDRIVQDLGPMPKKAGSDRDSWLAMAAKQLKLWDLGSFNDASRIAYEDVSRRFSDPKDVTNAIRRLERNVEKHREGAFKYRKLEQRANLARALDTAEAYLAEAGEVEARNVQARLDPTVLADADDNVRFPPDTADRLRNKQIISNLREGQNLPKFSQGDRKSTGIMVLEQQVRGNGQLKNLFEAQGLDIDNLQKVNPSKLQALLEMAERRRMINPRSAVALRKGLS